MILKKLPTNSQLLCRLVCKQWKMNVEKLTSIKLILLLNFNHFESMIDRKKLKNFEIERQHPNLKENMRRITVDWFVEVQEDHQMSEAALFLGWEYLDRFLSKCKDVSHKSLQLFSICCLWLASKFEDTQHQALSEIENVCDNTFTKQEILWAEKQVLNVLNWELYCPTIYTLSVEYHQYLKESLPEYSRKKVVGSFINFLCSICVYYSKYVFEYFSSKEISASLVFLSSYLLKEIKEWPDCFVEKLGLSINQKMRECIKRIFELYKEFHLICSKEEKTSKPAIFSKFSSDKYEYASLYRFSSIEIGV